MEYWSIVSAQHSIAPIVQRWEVNHSKKDFL